MNVYLTSKDGLVNFENFIFLGKMCIKGEDLDFSPKTTMVHQHITACKGYKKMKRVLHEEAKDSTLRRAFFLWMEDQLVPQEEKGKNSTSRSAFFLWLEDQIFPQKASMSKKARIDYKK